MVRSHLKGEVMECDTLVERFLHAGLRISIYLDDCAQGPGEDDSVFLVADHRDFTVHHKGKLSVFHPADALCKYDCDEEHEHSAECPQAGKVEPSIAKDYHVFLLHAHIHSGVRLYLGHEVTGRRIEKEDAAWEAPSDPGGWDTSMLGLVFVSRKPGEFGSTTPEMVAASLVEEWNMYLSGDVYYYVVERQVVEKKEWFDERGRSIRGATVDKVWIGADEHDGSLGGICGLAQAMEMVKHDAETISKALGIEPKE